MLQFITFYLGGERYAVDILLSKEIAKIHEVTVVPESQDYIVGLFTGSNSNDCKSTVFSSR